MFNFKQIGSKLKEVPRKGGQKLEGFSLWVVIKVPLKIAHYVFITLTGKVSSYVSFTISRETFQYGGWIVVVLSLLVFIFFGLGTVEQNIKCLEEIVFSPIQAGAEKGFDSMVSSKDAKSLREQKLSKESKPKQDSSPAEKVTTAIVASVDNTTDFVSSLKDGMPASFSKVAEVIRKSNLTTAGIVCLILMAFGMVFGVGVVREDVVLGIGVFVAIVAIFVFAFLVSTIKRLWA